MSVDSTQGGRTPRQCPTCKALGWWDTPDDRPEEIRDGDLVKCLWREDEFYALVVHVGDRDMAICVLDPPPDYRQLPKMAVIAHWRLIREQRVTA